MKYKEAQIHGEVDFRRHVERLVAHERHRSIAERLKAPGPTGPQGKVLKLMENHGPKGTKS